MSILELDRDALAARIDALLPQTQCTRCGYPDCGAYAQAVADGGAEINRCPPGGSATISCLAELCGRRPLPLDPDCGQQAPRAVAVIDEAWCIGCTLCIQACPVDAIVGAAKRMHTVIQQECTGCDLCLVPCPVDCIVMAPVRSGPRTVEGWLESRAPGARKRYLFRRQRLEAKREVRDRARARGDRVARGTIPSVAQRKAEVEAALRRVRERRRPALGSRVD